MTCVGTLKHIKKCLHPIHIVYLKSPAKCICCGAVLKYVLLSEIRLTWFKFRTLNHLNAREIKENSF
jgi:hypothetical protein